LKPIGAGSEIDAWCTKCRLDLGHRIIAMVGGRPKRVICQTCGSQHNYRAPKSAPRARAERKSSEGSSAPRKTHKARAESDRLSEWESRIAGQSVAAFTRYSIERRLSHGELVLHSKFGEGYVLDVLEDGKVAVMFRDGPRTLAHAAR
jgi:hypothetical protein